MGRKFEDIKLYQQIVGSLIYLSNATRPDIAFSVGVLARSMSSPSQADYNNAKHVMRYLVGSKNLVLKYNCQQNLVGYSDASYAEEEDRKSVGGYLFMQAGAVISWRSAKQPIVAMSSCEAEYIALSEACKEAVWIRKLQKEIQPEIVKLPVVIFEDNQSTIKLGNNPIHSNRTKHIDVRYHKIQEWVRDKAVKLEYMSTAEMTADIMTKSVGKILIERFREKMGLC